MNKIIMIVSEEKEYFIADITGGKHRTKATLQKNEGDLAKFALNQSMSFQMIEEWYQMKDGFSHRQRKELFEKMMFVYIMERFLCYVAEKQEFKINYRDFSKFDELRRIEVKVYEK